MALSGIDATDFAFSKAAFNASGVLMSGFGSPARTATPRPTRAMSTVGPGANFARAAVSCITSIGTIPTSNGLREVADLVVRALSNREIADSLVLSERTVESHVRSILAKLGLANRTELIARRR